MSPEEQALVRAPFFLARVRATLPLAGFAAADALRLRADWHLQSLARYGGFLFQVRGAAAAQKFLLDQTAGEPALREAPLLRPLLSAPPSGH
jgi:hypothetical protein